ncbi:MAG: hypothetical protein EPO21_21970 [Chloroflexota bacterium]|nr:MAG: hypothetical protein EPO21_21970 [Chloroflexota bacterium]
MDLSSISDKQICQLLMAGDDDAFLEYVKRYGEYAGLIILRLTGKLISEKERAAAAWKALYIVQDTLANHMHPQEITDDTLRSKTAETAQKIALVIWRRKQMELR